MIQIAEEIDVEITAAEKRDGGAAGDQPAQQEQYQRETAQQQFLLQRQRARCADAFFAGLPE